MIDLLSIRSLATPEHEALVEAFHRGIYQDAFAHQEEPLEAWKAALRGERPYELCVRLARDGAGSIVAGIAYERYPRSRCGLVTYMVVAPAARRSGLGRRLQGEAADELFAAGAPAVFGEVNDPTLVTHEPREVAEDRLRRNLAWGARIVDTRYIQPSLGPGLARDRTLLLIALAGATPLGDTMPGAVVRAFVEELYEVCEGGPPAAELQIPETVQLRRQA